MTPRVRSMLALCSSMRLQGHTAPAALSPNNAPSGKPAATGGAVGLARQAGLKDFTAADPVRRPGQSESTLALAVRLGLPGFESKSKKPASNDAVKLAPATPMRPAAATVSPALRAPVSPAAVPPSRRIPAAAAATPLRFVIVDIAAGSTAAFTALEGKMGRPFASTINGQASWLQRTNVNGSQTRALPLMDSDVRRFAAVAGDLGVPVLRLSVGPVSLAEFSSHTAAGPVPKGTRSTTTFVHSSMPDLLKRALKR